MSFTLEDVVPWGRSYDEYVSMFSLSDADLGKRILGCGDGPAAFNAQLTKRGGDIVSVDPIYQFSVDEIKNRIGLTYDIVLSQVRENQEEFIWTSINSIEELGRIRMEAMDAFLADYIHGNGRYIAGELPSLDFSDMHFGLALCSHFLFLYSEQFSEQYHYQSVSELCRVAEEVRIFPLLQLGGKRSQHLEPVMEQLTREGHYCEVVKVAYEFQLGGNEMLKIISA